MSEVKRYYVNLDHGTRYSPVDGCDQAMNKAEDLDRVTAERDAAIEDRDAWKGTAETFEDFYRKTEVERDAALEKLAALEGVEHARDVYFGSWKRTEQERDALQQRLTAADERADSLEAGIKWETERNALLLDSLTDAEDMLSVTSLEAGRRMDVLEGLLREVQKSARKQDWASGYPTLFASVDAALKPSDELAAQHAAIDFFDAALKPSEGGGDAARIALRPENQRITPARFKCLACGEYHEGSGNLPCPSMSPYSRIEQ